jgi:hypothetical protein
MDYVLLLELVKKGHEQERIKKTFRILFLKLILLLLAMLSHVLRLLSATVLFSATIANPVPMAARDISGQSMGVRLANGLNTSNWMKAFPNLALTQMILFGSHDAGASTETPPIVFGRYCAATQDATIEDQLNYGARYLDLRLCKKQVSRKLKLCHGLIQFGTFEDAINAIDRFTTSNPSEKVVIDIAPNWQTFLRRDEAFHDEIFNEEIQVLLPKLITNRTMLTQPVGSYKQQIAFIRRNGYVRRAWAKCGDEFHKLTVDGDGLIVSAWPDKQNENDVLAGLYAMNALEPQPLSFPANQIPVPVIGCAPTYGWARSIRSCFTGLWRTSGPESHWVMESILTKALENTSTTLQGWLTLDAISPITANGLDMAIKLMERLSRAQMS